MHVIRNYAHRLTRDDDATQAVCLVVLENLDRFTRSEPNSFSKWISRICRFKKLRSREDKSKARQRKLDDFADLASTGEVSFFDVSELPPKIRVVADGFLRGETVVEISKRTGINLGTLRNRIKRHRQRLTITPVAG